jgi:EAL domain-containing protein (putative c-di-GMP-specific phosphodiesterase class I)
LLERGEIMGQIFISLYKATNEYTSMDIVDIENALLDDIKMNFGHVPIEVYNRRLENFTSQLQRIKFAFEPIVNLGIRNPQIDSWEALARDPETGRAPVGLFVAAKLWGNKFIRILDLYCLNRATKTYVDVWTFEHKQVKKDPLSVNVFPNTLYHPDYFSELEGIVNLHDMLKGKELVLENSEQLPIPPVKEKLHTDSVTYFENRLHEYHNKFDISFAIDDFGSGYASIGRMIKLELDHVKIDREILHYKFPLDTINYVINTVRGVHRHQNTNIVVEGYDGESRVTLAEIYGAGIKYVQGHLLRRAGETVRGLEDEVKKFIIEQLNQAPPTNINSIIESNDIN